MKIRQNDWKKYISTLQRLNEKAGKEFRKFLLTDPAIEDIIEYAFVLTSKYGEGAGALAAEMYDSIAEMQGIIVQPAVIAKTATRQEIAKAIKESDSIDQKTNAIKGLVKRVASDTMLQNASRDNAQFAWISYGDTCPFCMAIASRGWRNISKRTLRNGHAEHIHSNCDCEYAIRFTDDFNVESYDPEKFREAYDNAEGSKWRDKVNAMRREQYEKNKELIRKQKREAYARNKAETSEK